MYEKIFGGQGSTPDPAGAAHDAPRAPKSDPRTCQLWIASPMPKAAVVFCTITVKLMWSLRCLYLRQ